MFCTKCGYQLSRDMKFCKKCGTEVDAISSEPSGNISIEPEKVYEDMRGNEYRIPKRPKKWVYILITVFTIVCIVCIVGILNNQNNKPGLENKTSQVIKIGDEASIGKTSLKVTKAYYTSTISDSSFSKDAEGVYLVVEYTVKNIGNEDLTLVEHDTKIVDANDRVYNAAQCPLDQDKRFQGERVFILSTINPGGTYNGLVAFDVPDKKGKYDFEYTAEADVKAIRITLSDIEDLDNATDNSAKATDGSSDFNGPDYQTGDSNEVAYSFIYYIGASIDDIYKDFKDVSWENVNSDITGYNAIAGKIHSFGNDADCIISYKNGLVEGVLIIFSDDSSMLYKGQFYQTVRDGLIAQFGSPQYTTVSDGISSAEILAEYGAGTVLLDDWDNQSFLIEHSMENKGGKYIHGISFMANDLMDTLGF